VDCWRRFELTNEGKLVLEDAVGVEQFMLSEAEFSDLSAIVSSQEFIEALQQRSCRHVPDADMTIELILENSERLFDPVVTGCAGDPNDLRHPYAKLVWRLVALKKAYLSCPPFDPLVSWDTTKPPPVRMLCYACGGNC
jgi:hypothetical protein